MKIYHPSSLIRKRVVVKMKENIREKLEELVGKLIGNHALAEQGGTSEVSKIETSQGSFLLKSSSDKEYRVWLAEEAKVLEKINREKQIPTPQFHGFIEQKDSSNLIMSFEKE